MLNWLTNIFGKKEFDTPVKSFEVTQSPKIKKSEWLTKFFRCVLRDKQDKYLNKYEQLYIAEKSNLTAEDLKPSHYYIKRLGYLYFRTGCFEKAREYFSDTYCFIELGDIAWCLGDFDEAYKIYLKRANREKLINLAFYQKKWQTVIEQASLFCTPEPSSRIFFDYTSRNLHMMIAVVVVKIRPEIPLRLAKTISKVDEKYWKGLISAAEIITDEEIEELGNKCSPKFAQTKKKTLNEALEKGKTENAVKVVTFLDDYENKIKLAKESFSRYIKDGNKERLAQFVDAVVIPGSRDLIDHVLNRVIDQVELTNPTAKSEILLPFYSSHPHLKSIYYGYLLGQKLSNNITLSPDEILLGMLQANRSWICKNGIKHRLSMKDFSFINRLITDYHFWAEQKIKEWLLEEGKIEVEKVAKSWRNYSGILVRQTPDGEFKYHFPSPVDMVSWNDLLEKVIFMLKDKWESELAGITWKTEAIIYIKIKKTFHPYKVVQHASPSWLSPQHLDIFIPKLSLAIEYMGEQHFKPIGLFGGDEGLKATIQRDKRKAAICAGVDIELIYINYDEDIDKKIKAIKEKYIN